jgi:hypothetical protein
MLLEKTYRGVEKQDDADSEDVEILAEGKSNKAGASEQPDHGTRELAPEYD